MNQEIKNDEEKLYSLMSNEDIRNFFSKRFKNHRELKKEFLTQVSKFCCDVMEPTNLLIITFIRFHCPSFFRSVKIGFVREIFKVIKDQSSLFHNKNKLRRSKKFREKYERTKTSSDKPVWEKQNDGTFLLLSGKEDYQFNITFSFEKAYTEWINTKDDN